MSGLWEMYTISHTRLDAIASTPFWHSTFACSATSAVRPSTTYYTKLHKQTSMHQVIFASDNLHSIYTNSNFYIFDIIVII